MNYNIEVSFLISGLACAFAIYFGLLNAKRNQKTDERQDATQMTTVIIKLENIGNSLAEFKSEMSSSKLDIKENRERIIKVEEIVKQLVKAKD